MGIPAFLGKTFFVFKTSTVPFVDPLSPGPIKVPQTVPDLAHYPLGLTSFLMMTFGRCPGLSTSAARHRDTSFEGSAGLTFDVTLTCWVAEPM